MVSEIKEDIATEGAMDINVGREDRNFEGDEFELHMNTNETENSKEDDAITVEGNMERGTHNKFLMLTSYGSMDVIGEIAVDNNMILRESK